MKHVGSMGLFVGTDAERQIYTAADAGQRWWTTDTERLWVWDGWAWVESTLAADSVTKTVKAAGGDFATIQAAINWFKGRIISGACKISVDAGSYDEAIIFEELFIAKGGALELEGDTRVLAGISYVDGATANQAALANGGSGAVTLSSAGNDITITCAIADPDLDADGWANSDKILFYDRSANTITEYIINSVLNNTITLTAAAPATGNDGDAILLKPDRLIARTSAGPCITVDTVKGVKIDGWFLDTHTGANCHGLYVINGGGAICENVATNAEDYGFQANGNLSWITASDGACSAWGCLYYSGFAAFRFASVQADYSYVVKSGSGYNANEFAYIVNSYSTAVKCSTAGYYAVNHATMMPNQCTARWCGTGYLAAAHAFMEAVATNANNNGNGTDYNPAPVIPAYTEGNGYAVMYAS